VAHAALAALEDIARERSVPEELLSRLRSTYELRISRLKDQENGRPGAEATDQPLAEDIRHRLLEAQRQAVAEIRAERETASGVLDGVSRDIDLDETRSHSQR
jgi:hypothetical protein